MTTPCLAVIPARGGSKRIPHKNIVPLGGQPMIVHTIRAALESGLFDKVVVSTDDAAIAEVARRSGAEVPFLRSAEIADDHTPVSLVTHDVLMRLDPEGTRWSSVAQLMPNCPLRTTDDVRASFQQFTETDAAAQLSVIRFGWMNPWWAFSRGAEFQLTPLFPEALRRRSQDLPVLLGPTGAVWWTKASSLRRTRTYHIPERTGWEIPWQRGIDIDTREDLEMAEVLFQTGWAVASGHAGA